MDALLLSFRCRIIFGSDRIPFGPSATKNENSIFQSFFHGFYSGNQNTNERARNDTVSCSSLISSAKSISLKGETVITRTRQENYKKYESLAGSPKTVIQVCQHNSIKVVRLGKPFICPFHPKELHPSAALWKKSEGLIMLQCFHEHLWWSIPEVIAFLRTNKKRQLGVGEQVVWWLQALEEIGLANPPLVLGRRLPEHVPPYARKLYDGFRRLLALRKLYEPDQNSAPFSWGFAMRWCAVNSVSSVQSGMKWLLLNGYLKIIQKNQGGSPMVFALI